MPNRYYQLLRLFITLFFYSWSVNQLAYAEKTIDPNSEKMVIEFLVFTGHIGI